MNLKALKEEEEDNREELAQAVNLHHKVELELDNLRKVEEQVDNMEELELVNHHKAVNHRKVEELELDNHHPKVYTYIMLIIYVTDRYCDLCNKAEGNHQLAVNHLREALEQVDNIQADQEINHHKVEVQVEVEQGNNHHLKAVQEQEHHQEVNHLKVGHHHQDMVMEQQALLQEVERPRKKRRKVCIILP